MGLLHYVAGAKRQRLLESALTGRGLEQRCDAPGPGSRCRPHAVSFPCSAAQIGTGFRSGIAAGEGGVGKNTDSRAADVLAAKLAEQQHGLITRAQALALGMSSTGIQRRVQSGHWECLRRGIYSFAGVPKTRSREILEACLGAGEGAVTSGFTAAEVLRLPNVWRRDRITLTVKPSVRRRSKGATISSSRFIKSSADRATRDGIPVTSVARTYVDLAELLPAHVLERSITQAVRNDLVTPEDLNDAVARGGDPEAVETMRDILAAETWENVFRSDDELRAVQLLRESGVDDIRTNVEMSFAGIRVGEVDILISDYDFILEIDGPIDHSSPEAKARDKVRRLAYRAMGYRVLAINPDRLKDPGDLANLIARELQKPRTEPVSPEEFRRLWAGWVEKYGDPNARRAGREPRSRRTSARHEPAIG